MLMGVGRVTAIGFWGNTVGWNKNICTVWGTFFMISKVIDSEVHGVCNEVWTRANEDTELLLNECRQRAQALKRNANLTFYGIINTKMGKIFYKKSFLKQ